MLITVSASNSSFVRSGGRRWRSEPREPSQEIYGRIFGRTDSNEARVPRRTTNPPSNNVRPLAVEVGSISGALIATISPI